MNTCGTCKYWGRDGYPLRFENCTAMECTKIIMPDSLNRDDPNNPIETQYEKDESGRIVKAREYMRHLAFVQDGSSYRADLITRPDFGCVLWEQR